MPTRVALCWTEWRNSRRLESISRGSLWGESSRTLRDSSARIKNLVHKMKGQLYPKTQHTYVGFAKEIRKSLVDDEGEVVFPIAWNNAFIALPRINKRLQRRGKISALDFQGPIKLGRESGSGCCTSSALLPG